MRRSGRARQWVRLGGPAAEPTAPAKRRRRGSIDAVPPRSGGRGRSRVALGSAAGAGRSVLPRVPRSRCRGPGPASGADASCTEERDRRQRRRAAAGEPDRRQRGPQRLGEANAGSAKAAQPAPPRRTESGGVGRVRRKSRGRAAPAGRPWRQAIARRSARGRAQRGQSATSALGAFAVAAGQVVGRELRDQDTCRGDGWGSRFIACKTASTSEQFHAALEQRAERQPAAMDAGLHRAERHAGQLGDLQRSRSPRRRTGRWRRAGRRRSSPGRRSGRATVRASGRAARDRHRVRPAVARPRPRAPGRAGPAGAVWPVAGPSRR